MIPSLIDFLDVVACDTELHFLDRVSRVAANVIFFCFFFPFFSPLFFSVSSVGTNSGRDTVERQNGRKSKRRPERCSCRGRERPSKKKKKCRCPWWTRDRGATFWNYSKIACFGLTMLEWSKPRPGRHWFSIFQHRATDIGRTQSSRLIKQHANSANSYILKRTHGKLTSCKQDTRWILRKYWLAVRSSADMPTIPLYVWQIHRTVPPI